MNIYFGIESHHNNPWRIDVSWRVSLCHSGAGLGKIHLKNTNLYCTNVVNNLGYLCELKIYWIYYANPWGMTVIYIVSRFSPLRLLIASPPPCFLFMCLFMEEKRSLFQLQKMQNHRVHSFHQLWNSRRIWDPKIQVTSNHTSYLSFLGRHHIFRPAKSTQKIASRQNSVNF